MKRACKKLTSKRMIKIMRVPYYVIENKSFNSMKTNEIIKEIEQLPLSKQIYVVERTIHTIRKKGIDEQMSVAADALY